MSPELWVPGVVVLALGAGVGWWMTRKARPSAAAEEDSPKDSLEVADLRRRRDELYRRLRAANLEDEERQGLELEAARTLQKLDLVLEQKPLIGDQEAREASTPAEAVEVVPHSKARTLLTGFAFGGGSAALIALLIFWAGRDATERDQRPAGMGAQPTAEQPHPVGSLAPEVAGEVNEILAHLESNPEDAAARKRLALLYLASDQYVPAFEQADAVLAVAPDDIDSLYVQGVVRMTMGQDDIALAQLDRVLELFPEHVRAMTVKGLVFARRGDRAEAAAIWNRALEVGGHQPQIEDLLAMLEGEATGDPHDHPPAGSSGESRLTAPDEYRVRVEADVIPGFPQTGTLFVALRTADGAPPIAVKRIDQPTFPMLVSLGPADMMMAAGSELPESGTLTVRLDQDGSVATQGENDLEGSATVSRGDLITMMLN